MFASHPDDSAELRRRPAPLDADGSAPDQQKLT
jgi:hypothetical protein